MPVQGTVKLDGKPLARASKLLAEVRGLAGVATFAEVRSHNDFPTASGLASSASGFAALALAATRALGLELPEARVSALARAASASAARSLFGGYVELGAGADAGVATPAASNFGSMLVSVTNFWNGRLSEA